MAMVYDEFGYLREELLSTTRCAGCGSVFREDESDWGSLCQDCGEAEDEKDR